MSSIHWRDLDQKTSPRAGGERTAAAIQPQPSLYDVLEVSPRASSEVLKAAYRALMGKCHPDRHPEHRRLWAEEMARRLNHAYAILSNPQERSAYDHAHGIRRTG
jgi:curved DNA-binding protein CbpA